MPRTGLIVIGFMGGNVHADNLVHREALVAQELEQHYPCGLHAAVFANHDGRTRSDRAAAPGREGRRRLTAQEKSAARIVIYGHSWGASETVTLARRLNELGIPVLLTIQVDSVEKSNEDDGSIPPNVHEAVNFYQTRGPVHGRSRLPRWTRSRRRFWATTSRATASTPISCAGFPWFARAFMKPHIEIENDPAVWTRIEALIRAEAG